MHLLTMRVMGSDGAVASTALLALVVVTHPSRIFIGAVSCHKDPKP